MQQFAAKAKIFFSNISLSCTIFYTDFHTLKYFHDFSNFFLIREKNPAFSMLTRFPLAFKNP